MPQGAEISPQDASEGVPKDDFRTIVIDEATAGIRIRWSFDAPMIADAYQQVNSGFGDTIFPSRQEVTLYATTRGDSLRDDAKAGSDVKLAVSHRQKPPHRGLKPTRSDVHREAVVRVLR